MEKQSITIATLCYVTMQQWRIVQSKTMNYDSYFMLYYNATLEVANGVMKNNAFYAMQKCNSEDGVAQYME